MTEAISIYFGKPLIVQGLHIYVDYNVVFTYGELRPFALDHENKIFDVWEDGHFLDYGEEVYTAVVDNMVEEVLLQYEEIA